MAGCQGLLALTTEENALDFLERAAEFAQRQDLPTWPKWVAICLHHALYGFLICALHAGGDERRFMAQGKKGKWLISFGEALGRAQDDSWMMQYAMSKPLVLSPSEAKAIRFLQGGLRNGFMHFAPHIWGIEHGDVTEVIPHVLRVVTFLVFESGNLVLLSDQQRSGVRLAIEGIRAGIEQARRGAIDTSPGF